MKISMSYTKNKRIEIYNEMLEEKGPEKLIILKAKKKIHTNEGPLKD